MLHTPASISRLFHTGIDAELLIEIMRVVLSQWENRVVATSDGESDTVDEALLERIHALASTGRMSMTMAFLGVSEKVDIASVLDKLGVSLGVECVKGTRRLFFAE